MPRPQRLRIQGGIYHVMNRGNRKAVIFEDKRDRRRFQEILADCLEIFSVRLLAGCLIPNHFHCTVETPRGNLPEFMEQLESRFARYSNQRYERVGHLFQGRFQDVVIEHDLHLFTTLSYIFLNPVRARLAAAPEGCEWSTYAATIGVASRPSYLSLDWLDWLFPAATMQQSQARLRAVMSEPRPVAAYLVQGELELLDPKTPIRSYVADRRRAAAHEERIRLASRPSLAELLSNAGQDLGGFIICARVTHGYKMVEIARALGLPTATVSTCFWKSWRRPHR